MKKKILAILMVAVFVLTSIPILASDLQGLRRDYEDAQADVREHEAELALIQAAMEQIYEDLRILDERLISATNDLIIIDHVLLETRDALDQAALDIIDAQYELDRQYESIRTWLRAMQEQGSMGLLSVLFQATSLRDFLLRMEQVNDIARRDQEMVARLESSEARLAQVQESYARQYDSIERLLISQQNYLAYLEQVEAERYEYFAALVEDETHQTALLLLSQEHASEARAMWREAEEAEQRRREADRLERERIAAEQQQEAIANLSGRFLWPVPSSFSISSPFGPRIHPITRRQDNHSGIDIRASHGSDIRAAYDGVVTLSGWNGGYGLTVMIYHGGGVHTLYGHNSANLVSVGDRVTRGQVIARIGSTGVSTGPHLHFEVRVGGRAVDPGPYLGL